MRQIISFPKSGGNQLVRILENSRTSNTVVILIFGLIIGICRTLRKKKF